VTKLAFLSVCFRCARTHICACSVYTPSLPPPSTAPPSGPERSCLQQHQHQIILYTFKYTFQTLLCTVHISTHPNTNDYKLRMFLSAQHHYTSSPAPPPRPPLFACTLSHLDCRSLTVRAPIPVRQSAHLFQRVFCIPAHWRVNSIASVPTRPCISGHTWASCVHDRLTRAHPLVTFSACPSSVHQVLHACLHVWLQA
jgi:hypothetical protein